MSTFNVNYPEEILCSEKKIFFDITLLTLLNKKNAGITRICIEFCIWFLNNKKINIDFVYYDPKFDDFLIINQSLLAKIIKDFNEGVSNENESGNSILYNELSRNHESTFVKASFDKCSCFFDVSLNVNPQWYSKIIQLKKSYQFNLVMVCYDLIPIFCPYLGFNKSDFAALFKSYFCFLLECSDYVFAISNYTKKDIKRFASLNRIRLPLISIIKDFGANILKGRSEKSKNPSVEILGKDFLLCVSSIEKRKNHETLYKAYSYLLEKGYKNLPKLVFCGSIKPGMENSSKRFFVILK